MLQPLVRARAATSPETCLYCRGPLPVDPRVSCERAGCGAPYHEECWNECRARYGGCAVYGCGSREASSPVTAGALPRAVRAVAWPVRSVVAEAHDFARRLTLEDDEVFVLQRQGATLAVFLASLPFQLAAVVFGPYFVLVACCPVRVDTVATAGWALALIACALVVLLAAAYVIPYVTAFTLAAGWYSGRRLGRALRPRARRSAPLPTS